MHNPSEVYPLIKELLNELQDRHSHFILPQPLNNLQSTTKPTPTPSFALIDGTWGYLELPTCGGSDAVCQEYVDSAHQTLTNYANVSGWVVDLRGNRGGNVWAMLPVVGALLGDGVLGKFIARDGKEVVWGYRAGASCYEDEIVYQAHHPVAHQGNDLPIALLLSAQTASSGEIIAATILGHKRVRSFGQPTQGIPTANTNYELPDGALLVLTTALTVDRHGRIYESSITPDVIIENVNSDDCLTAAVQWLSTLR